MDVVEDIVSRAPLRHLSDIFTIFKLFWQNVQSVQVNQEQFRVLAYSIAQLLQTLDREYRAGHFGEHKTFVSLEGLRKFVLHVIQNEASYRYSLLVGYSRRLLPSFEERRPRLFCTRC